MDTVFRDVAVTDIAARLADRDAFVLLGQPDATRAIGERIDQAGDWTCYIDNGTDNVLRINDLTRLALATTVTATLGLPTVAVFLVPKTVPAKVLADALGQEIPADGSRDIIGLYEREHPLIWPMMFVEALERVDPQAALVLHANALGKLS